MELHEGELVQDDGEKLIEDRTDPEVSLSVDDTSIETDPDAWVVKSVSVWT